MAEAVTVGATLRTGWPVLVIPSAIYFVSHFHRIALGVVAQDLMRAFTITAATLGALAAIYPYVFVAMALVAGSLADTLEIGRASCRERVWSWGGGGGVVRGSRQDELR